MQDLVQILRAEHDDLRLAARILAAMAGRVADGDAFPSIECVRVLLFLQDFAVGVHFQKEGQTLLPAAAIYGTPQDAVTAGATLRSQAQFKELLHMLVLFWEPGGDLTDAERHGFETTSRALGSCLERCLQLEEAHLFTAVQHLPGDERMEWPDRFAAAERGRRARADWHRELVDLAARWARS